jgi:hypothetical protein
MKTATEILVIADIHFFLQFVSLTYWHCRRVTAIHPLHLLSELKGIDYGYELLCYCEYGI